MSTAGFSGKGGKATFTGTDVVDVTKWTMTKEVSTTRYASSGTGGYKATIAGVRSASGSIEFVYNEGAAGSAAINEGTTGELKLYTDGVGNKYYDFNAGSGTNPGVVFKNFKISVDINDGSVVSGSCDWESHLGWSEANI